MLFSVVTWKCVKQCVQNCVREFIDDFKNINLHVHGLSLSDIALATKIQYSGKWQAKSKGSRKMFQKKVFPASRHLFMRHSVLPLVPAQLRSDSKSFVQRNNLH